MRLAPVAVALAALTSGCGAANVRVAPAMAANAPPAIACPWVDGEHYRVPARLVQSAAVPPAVAAQFVSGCAIIRFTVAQDGSVSSAALRAANPLNDGPTALAVLHDMRFVPVRNPSANFVIRLGMQKDAAGNVTITPETRARLLRFWDLS